MKRRGNIVPPKTALKSVYEQCGHKKGEAKNTLSKAVCQGGVQSKRLNYEMECEQGTGQKRKRVKGWGTVRETRMNLSAAAEDRQEKAMGRHRQKEEYRLSRRTCKRSGGCGRGKILVPDRRSISRRGGKRKGEGGR